MTSERNEPQPESAGQIPAVSPDVLMLIQTLGDPVRTAADATIELSDEQKGQLIDQIGRRSDQDDSFRKLVLIVGSIVFCLVIAAVIGLIVFMTVQDETAVLGAILSGLGGLIAGLGSGIGGTAYWFVSRRR